MNRKNHPWKNWKHITKLDPDKYLSPDNLDTIVGSGTDAIMISGTQNITETNVGQLISHLRDYDIPKILEPVTPDAVLGGEVDYIFVPLVLNAGDLDWIVGKHKDWIQTHAIDWGKVIPEAYIVMNPESAVAKLTKSKTDLTPDDVIAYAKYAEKYLRLPIVYIEYSGTYGDPKIVKQLSESLTEASLFYGGGIDSHAAAAEMMRYADVIVVGNVVYTDIDKFIETIP
ncbi:MAG: phosphoglycerol geranylgeranyltransferase [Candidatus Methanospirareceae archaeon]